MDAGYSSKIAGVNLRARDYLYMQYPPLVNAVYSVSERSLRLILYRSAGYFSRSRLPNRHGTRC